MPFRLFLVLCGAASAAAQVHPAPLSLDEAIRLAWANDPTVAAFALTPELARAREEQAGVRPNPEIELRGSTSTPLNNDKEWAVGVGLSQRLPRRERVEQARALARLGGESATLLAHEQRRRVAGEVRQRYYEIAVHQTRLELARRTLDAQRELRTTLERRRAAGEIPAAELDLLAGEIRRTEQALAFADADGTVALGHLRSRLRLAAHTPLTLNLNLPALLDRAVPTAPAVLEHARPTLALASHRVRQAEAALALARSESRGEWTVGGGLDLERRANDYSGRLENDPRLSVGASVPWPRPVANRGDIREKQAAVRIAEAELAALRDELHAEINAAVAAARALQPVLAAYRTSLDSGAAIPESLRAAYDRGEVTALQLAQARQQRFALESDFIQAAARYAAALADAETAAGLIPTLP